MKSELDEAAEDYAMTDFEDVGFASEEAFKAGAKWAMKQGKVNTCFIGVGDGTGQLFVYGSYNACKRVQNIILEWEKLKSQI